MKAGIKMQPYLHIFLHMIDESGVVFIYDDLHMMIKLLQENIRIIMNTC